MSETNKRYRLLAGLLSCGEVREAHRQTEADWSGPRGPLLEEQLNALAEQGYRVAQPPQLSGAAVLVLMEKAPEGGTVGGPADRERQAAEQDLTGPITIRVRAMGSGGGEE